VGKEKGKSYPLIPSLTLKLVSLLLFHRFTVTQFVQLQQINTQDLLFHLLLKHSALTAVLTAPTL